MNVQLKICLMPKNYCAQTNRKSLQRWIVQACHHQVHPCNYKGFEDEDKMKVQLKLAFRRLTTESADGKGTQLIVNGGRFKCSPAPKRSSMINQRRRNLPGIRVDQTLKLVDKKTCHSRRETSFERTIQIKIWHIWKLSVLRTTQIQICSFVHESQTPLVSEALPSNNPKKKKKKNWLNDFTNYAPAKPILSTLSNEKLEVWLQKKEMSDQQEHFLACCTNCDLLNHYQRKVDAQRKVGSQSNEKLFPGKKFTPLVYEVNSRIVA